ncbi:unnamed protein product [Ostreobium quekettii]|uniref:Uncharacterized protein n=1 Tax=Ostreobium quekettii TaxID=121088 RepID=A0A8S1J913_9CHLO|nr:unnamed protein product [Ostreobium quekettii]
MFYDLNHEYGDLDLRVRRERLATAAGLGFDCVANARVVVGRLSSQQAYRCPPEAVSEQDAFESASPGIKRALQMCQALGAQRRSIRQLTRITLVTDDVQQAQALTARNKALEAYDIVSVQPQNDAVFKQACTTLDVDLISVDISGRLPFQWHQKAMRRALERGIHFEVCYAGLLQGGAARRNAFANAKRLTQLTWGKGIIVSSGAASGMAMRGPHDVINLSTLLGLKQQQAKEAISKRCSDVVRHGSQRQALKGSIRIETSPLPAMDIQLSVGSSQSGSESGDGEKGVSSGEGQVQKRLRIEQKQ